MKWEDILKNIQITGQKTSSKDYVLPDEDDNDCYEKLIRLVDAINDLPKLFNRQYYEDTYWNSGDVSLIYNSYYVGWGRYIDEMFKKDLSLWTEEAFCWVVKKLMNLPDNQDPITSFIDPESEPIARFDGVVNFLAVGQRVAANGLIEPYNEGKEYVIVEIDIGIDGQHSEMNIEIVARKYQDIRNFIMEALS